MEYDILRQIMDNSLEAVAIVDLGGIIKYANKSTLKYFKTDKDIIGTNILDYIGEKNTKLYGDFLLKEFDQIEINSRDLKGNPHFYSLNGKHIQYEGKTNLLLTASDITKLKLREQLFFQLFENMEEGVALHEIIYDENNNPINYRIINTNPKYPIHTGIKPERLMRHPLATKLYGTDTPPYAEEFYNVVRTGIPYKFETHFKSLNKWFDVSVVSWDRKYFATVFTDITSEKSLREQLRQSQKMEAIGQLAGGIAHDFNNLLAGIIGSAELLKLETMDLPNIHIHNALDLLFNTAHRASDIVNQLLTFSRKKTAEKSEVLIHDIIRDANKLLRQSLRKNVKIHEKFEANYSMIAGEESLLQSAFLNLGINALDSMKDQENGDLTFQTNIVNLDAIYCKNSVFNIKPGIYLKIQIDDTGNGIEPEILDHIFNPFFTTKEKGKGTGLGLSIVYNTVAQHYGSIDVKSIMGKGTNFIMHLPLKLNKTYKTDALNADMASKNYEFISNFDVDKLGTILIVEDEDSIKQIISKILEKHGFKTILAENGKIGYELFNENKDSIDIIILDLIMPVMNGEECFKLIREINPTIPIILCSGFSDKDIISELRKKENVSFILKPFRVKQLIKEITTYLS